MVIKAKVGERPQWIRIEDDGLTLGQVHYKLLLDPESAKAIFRRLNIENSDAQLEILDFAHELEQSLKDKRDKLLEKVNPVLPQEPLAILETDKAIYRLLAEEALVLYPSGWYYENGTFASFAQPFSALTSVCPLEKKKEPSLKVEHYLADARYRNGQLEEILIHPIPELKTVSLGNTLATVVNKMMTVESLPTSLPYSVVDALKKGEEWPCTLKSVFASLHEKFRRFIALGEPEMSLIVCWTMATYFAEIFQIIPSLFFCGSQGCGKTRALQTITSASRRGIMIADPSDANYSRIVDAWRPTIAIDDFDESLRQHRSIVLSLIKHSYKATTRVPRLQALKAGGYKLELFSPFAPLAVSAVETLEGGQQLSRFFEILMRRSEHPLSPINPSPQDFDAERRQLYYLAFKLAPTIRKQYEMLEIPLQGRPRELWSPILTIAQNVDSELFNVLLQYAKEKVFEQLEKSYHNERAVLFAIFQLYKDGIWTHTKDGILFRFSMPQLMENLRKVLCEQWEDMDENEFAKVWSVRKLGRLLGTMGIRCERIGKKRERFRVLTQKELIELLKRYEVDSSELADIKDMADINISTIPHNTTLEEVFKNESLEAKNSILTKGGDNDKFAI